MAEFPAMVFKTADGKEYGLDVAGLNIAFVEGRMVATNSTESLTLPLEQLTEMQFGEKTTFFADATADVEGQFSVVNLNGVVMGTFESLDAAKAKLPAGVYVVKANSGQISKLVIRR